jgi:ribonucleoside-diphosphate reductase beta chain
MDKHILHGDTTFNLAPFAFPWAYDMAQKSLANHWTPQEVGMGNDRLCYEHTLTPAECEMFINVFASLTTADLAAASNLTERVYGMVKAAEIRLYVARQIAEEALHSASYQHVIEVLGLDQEEVYTLYRKVPAIADWFEFAQDQTADTHEDVLLPLIFWYLLYEGVFFVTAFAAIFSLQRRNLMTGTGTQIQYIFRDESMHVAFGAKLIKSIFVELGAKPQQQAVHRLFLNAMARIDAWADHCIPDVLGYSATLHKQHARYLADRRLKSIGYDPLFHAEPALPWLDEQVSLNKEKNFFETRTTEYQSGRGLDFGAPQSMQEMLNWRAS